MLRAIQGPLIVQPKSWTIVFDRSTDRPWLQWLCPGKYKHVRAYAYVPYLHVWVFIDPSLTGLEITIAADGDASAILAATWGRDADRIRMASARDGGVYLPAFGWCVPIIKRLLGLRCGALRPSSLYRYCLEHGGEPVEVCLVPTHPAASPA